MSEEVIGEHDALGGERTEASARVSAPLPLPASSHLAGADHNPASEAVAVFDLVRPGKSFRSEHQFAAFPARTRAALIRARTAAIISGPCSCRNGGQQALHSSVPSMSLQVTR
jgi:hypothetical protein